MESLGDLLQHLQRHNGPFAPELPAEPVCATCGGVGWLRKDRQPGEPDFGRLQPCPCQDSLLAANRQMRLRRWCELSEAQAALTFDRLVTRWDVGTAYWAEIIRTVGAFAHGEAPNPWLILRGPTGTGKTHLATAIVNYRLAHGGNLGKVVHVEDWLRELRNTFDASRRLEQGDDVPAGAMFEEVWLSYVQAPLLVLDDLGAHQHTDWTEAQIDALVDYRYRHRLETVITTNENHRGLGARVTSRIQDWQMSTVLTLRGPDFRHVGRTVLLGAPKKEAC